MLACYSREPKLHQFPDSSVRQGNGPMRPGPQYNPLLSLGILILRYPYPDPSKLAEKNWGDQNNSCVAAGSNLSIWRGPSWSLALERCFFGRLHRGLNVSKTWQVKARSRETGKSYMDGKKPCKEFEAAINFRLYGSVLFRCVFCFTPPNRCHSNRSFFGVDTNHWILYI